MPFSRKTSSTAETVTHFKFGTSQRTGSILPLSVNARTAEIPLCKRIQFRTTHTKRYKLHALPSRDLLPIIITCARLEVNDFAVDSPKAEVAPVSITVQPLCSGISCSPYHNGIASDVTERSRWLPCGRQNLPHPWVHLHSPSQV